MATPITDRPSVQAHSTSEVQANKRFDVLEEFTAVMIAIIDNFDKSLSKKIQDMKDKTQHANALNGVMTVLNKIKSSFASDAKPSDKVSKEKLAEYKKELEDAVRAAGIKLSPNQPTIESLLTKEKNIVKNGANDVKLIEESIEGIKNQDNLPADHKRTLIRQEENRLRGVKHDIEQAEKSIPYLEKGEYPPGTNMNIFDSDTTKNKVDDAINTVQGLTDNSNSTSQMEQLELQQLMSKRSNSFESLTSMTKKYFDVLSSTINKF